jgi:hypothetical protein
MVARFFLLPAYQIGKNIPNGHKLYQTAIHNSKCPKNIPNGHKIFQHFPFQGPPHFTKIKIFGLKTKHLATRVENEEKPGQKFQKCIFAFFRPKTFFSVVMYGNVAKL